MKFKTGLISLLVLVSVVSWAAAVDAGLPGDHAGKSGSKNTPKGASGGKGDASSLGDLAGGLNSAGTHVSTGQGSLNSVARNGINGNGIGGNGINGNGIGGNGINGNGIGGNGIGGNGINGNGIGGNGVTGNAISGNIIAGNDVNAHIGPTQINAEASADVDINGAPVPVPVVTVESYPVPSLGSVTLYMGDITVPLSGYSSQGNALWIEGSAGRWTQYATAARNVGLRLVAYSPSGGQAEIYETHPGSGQGMYTVREHAFSPGYNRVTVGMSDPGRHVFFFTVENQASGAVVVDVI